MNDHFKYNLLVTFVTTFHATSQEDHQGTDPLTSGWHYRGRTYKYNEVHVNEISQMTPPPRLPLVPLSEFSTVPKLSNDTAVELGSEETEKKE